MEWDVNKGLTFVAKGAGKHVYRVASLKNRKVVVLEKLGSRKGFVEVKRADMPRYISQILEVPGA